MYVKQDKTYDFAKLTEVTKVIVRNLNKIIDINYYPVEEVKIKSLSTAYFAEMIKINCMMKIIQETYL